MCTFRRPDGVVGMRARRPRMAHALAIGSIGAVVAVGCASNSGSSNEVADEPVADVPVGVCKLVDPAVFAIGGVIIQDPTPLRTLPDGNPLPTRDPRIERIRDCPVGSSSALTVYDTTSAAHARAVTDEFIGYVHRDWAEDDRVVLPSGIRGAAAASGTGTGFAAWQHRDLMITVLVGAPSGKPRGTVATMLIAVVRDVTSKLEAR